MIFFRIFLKKCTLVHQLELYDWLFLSIVVQCVLPEVNSISLYVLVLSFIQIEKEKKFSVDILISYKSLMVVFQRLLLL